jgi:hypothetical protein
VKTLYEGTLGARAALSPPEPGRTRPGELAVWVMDDILVPIYNRGKGAGTALLQQICADADREQVEISVDLHYDIPEGFDYKRISAWYCRHGFTIEPGSDFPWVLARKPAPLRLADSDYPRMDPALRAGYQDPAVLAEKCLILVEFTDHRWGYMTPLHLPRRAGKTVSVLDFKMDYQYRQDNGAWVRYGRAK